jgi:hypothetical protein
VAMEFWRPGCGVRKINALNGGQKPETVEN